jgi:hypothetical protein
MAIARTAAAMLLMTAATAAGPPFESPASTTVAASTTIAATVSAAIGTSATAAAIPSAASKRPLKARPGIAAGNARRLARKFSKRFRSLPRHPRASFARKQNHSVINKRRGLSNFMSVFFVFAMLFVSFVRCVDFNVLAQRRNMQSVFVRGVSFGFSNGLR